MNATLPAPETVPEQKKSVLTCRVLKGVEVSCVVTEAGGLVVVPNVGGMPDVFAFDKFDAIRLACLIAQEHGYVVVKPERVAAGPLPGKDDKAPLPGRDGGGT